PNPAAEHITVIPAGALHPDRLEVLDANGRVVLLWSGTVPSHIPVGLLASGPYTVAVRAAGEWAVQRFVVAR
ncbi:MAG TPA: T9SS type A sorting domain-containing protein, partial [Flavobacteriales bacterium]|nr:T9SS type A sorting domain-containing protein [Flavobacteriales bacterium]